MRISDSSSDVCSSDLELRAEPGVRRDRLEAPPSEKQIAQDEQHRTVAEQFGRPPDGAECIRQISAFRHRRPAQASLRAKRSNPGRFTPRWIRSEEHTSELQSLMRISYDVFCLKKKTTTPHLT